MEDEKLLQFTNTKEDIAELQSNREFWVGLEKINEKFHQEVSQFSDKYGVEMVTKVFFEIKKNQKERKT